jgi:hypothetical protein
MYMENYFQNETSVKLYPKRYCVYFHWVDLKIVYIGMGSSSRPFSINGRTEGWHKITRNGYNVTIYDWYLTSQDALDIEQTLISTIKPMANVQLSASYKIKSYHKKLIIENYMSRSSVKQ